MRVMINYCSFKSVFIETPRRIGKSGKLVADFFLIWGVLNCSSEDVLVSLGIPGGRGA